ncbi:unnamed protein product [Sphenostylis stenocarpa]|uniref:Uncharacterized protein n=1 Tax=Sphenostylis stenocarpa TaxID=92480 RepID=A0AA86SMQ2_9FABA|nr:unnamed protein product [Sphenostylis stenocarpa]
MERQEIASQILSIQLLKSDSETKENGVVKRIADGCSVGKVGMGNSTAWQPCEKSGQKSGID